MSRWTNTLQVLVYRITAALSLKQIQTQTRTVGIQASTYLKHVSQTETIHLIIQAGGALPVPEWLQHRVRIPDVLSVTTPAADYRQPAAGMGASEEVWDDVPESEHPGARQ